MVKKCVRHLKNVLNWSELDLWIRRAIKTVAVISFLVLLVTFVYHWIYILFEEGTPPLHHSLQVMVETFTGTGYGSDAPWNSWVMNLFIVMVDMATFMILFIVFPYVFQPVLEKALSPNLPASVDLSDHIVICGNDKQEMLLMEELETLDRDYVVISDHEDQVLEWKQDDIPVVFGEPTSTDVLEGACADRAEAMIVDTGNDRAASVVLALRELNEHADIFVLVSDRADSQPLRYAGANRVMTPKRLLGQRIAARIKTEITPDLSDVISVSGEYCALEVSVFETSPVHGKTVRQIEEQTGGSVRVAGLWEEGEFVGSPAPGREVHEDMVLFLFGPESNVKDLEDQITGESSRETSVVVAGHGDVGETVVRELDRRRMNITVVDREDGARVDVVGDVTDEDILREAGIKDAAVFVVAIKDDDKAIMSVLIASNIAREQEIIVRVNDAENMERVRRAGAEYVLGLPEITARVLARDVLNEDVLTTGRQLKMIRLEARSLPDHLKTGETEFHSRCVLLAIERGSRLITERVEEVDLKDTDHLLIVGPDEQIGDVSRMREEALEIRDVS